MNRKEYPMYTGLMKYFPDALMEVAHTHAPQSFTKISPVQHKRKHIGWISPILGATNPAYLKNRPTAWLTGFSVLEVYNRKGYFNLYPVIVTEGQCAYAGKVYGK